MQSLERCWQGPRSQMVWEERNYHRRYTVSTAMIPALGWAELWAISVLPSLWRNIVSIGHWDSVYESHLLKRKESWGRIKLMSICLPALQLSQISAEKSRVILVFTLESAVGQNIQEIWFLNSNLPSSFNFISFPSRSSLDVEWCVSWAASLVWWSFLHPLPPSRIWPSSLTALNLKQATTCKTRK